MLANTAAAPSSATHEELVDRARGLVPMLRERAAETASARDVPLDIVDAIEKAGIPRSLTPRRWGGYELGFRTLCDTTYELAKGCASTAWCTSFLSAHTWIVCHFDEQAQAEVFGPDPDTRLGGIFAPMGQAKPVDGGFRLSGRWPWSSGIAHCPWTLVGAFIEGQAPPELHLFLLGPGDFTWDDTWFNVGLEGTGSHDTVVQDAFVPAHRVIPWDWVREGHGSGVDSNPAALYRTPLVPSLFSLLGMLALGSVRAAYEDFREWTKTRTSSVTGLNAADHPALQIGLTETAAEIDAAELLLARCIERVSDPDSLDYRLRVECKRDVSYSVQMLLRAIDRLMALGSARAFFDTNPLQRTWRDMHALSAHFTMNFQVAGELYGRLELGLEPPPRDHFF
jgi:alkylation response protein AidB-like acyl-CoA dehydrogenase